MSLRGTWSSSLDRWSGIDGRRTRDRKVPRSTSALKVRRDDSRGQKIHILISGTYLLAMSEQKAKTTRRRVLSGIQPTGEAHLGNYLGALRQWVHMQDENECFYCIVDQHAILNESDPRDLPQRTLDMAVSLLSVGIDPEKATLFVQSDVPEHIELAWLFNTVAPVGDLERMTQYKDRSTRYESIPVGLLNYPVLQAADILIYRADAVPVGDDQRQHLELTRQIARKWNARYGEYFPEPEAIVPETGRIIGLDGESKMSKSLGNTVGILADEEEVWARVRGAVTDPQRVRREDPGRPEVATSIRSTSYLPTRRCCPTSRSNVVPQRAGVWSASASSPTASFGSSLPSVSVQIIFEPMRTKCVPYWRQEETAPDPLPAKRLPKPGAEWG